MRYMVVVSFGITLSALPIYASRAQEAPPAPNAAEASETLRGRIPDTLMFSIDELNDIRTRAASGEAAAQTGSRDAIEDAALYLSTIVYYGSDNWTIWVNDKPLTSTQEIKSFEVSDIGPDFVELRVPLSAQGMRPVRLSPNQTFVVRSGAVVEGRWRR